MISKTTFNYKKSSQMFSVNISTERIITASNNLAKQLTPPTSRIISKQGSSSTNIQFACNRRLGHSQSVTVHLVILSRLQKHLTTFIP